MSRQLDDAEIATLLAGGETYRSSVVVRATRVPEDSNWNTPTGDPLKANAGDWWVIDGDDRWSVSDGVFSQTYESLGNGRYQKTATVTAIQMASDFAVRTLEGIASGQSGDWLVRNPTGECWPVSNAVFVRRYERVSSQHAP
jgi:hypothetical protein